MSDTIDTGQAMPASGNLCEKIKKHPLAFFFLFAFLFSWIVSIPFILAEWGVIKANLVLVFAIKSFGPFLSALLLFRILEGKEGIKRFNRMNRPAKTAWSWYLIVLLAIPALIMIGILIQPGTTIGFKGLQPSLLISYPLTFIAVFFGGGPLGEEPGWRGFALPRMQKQFGPLWGTLLLGVVWTCWHLPDFLTSAQGGGPGTGFNAFLRNFPLFLVLVLSISIILTWIYNRTGGSVFMVLLAHASVNTPQVVLVPLFPNLSVTGLNIAALAGFGVSALLILVLSRGRLGYKPAA